MKGKRGFNKRNNLIGMRMERDRGADIRCGRRTKDQKMTGNITRYGEKTDKSI